MNKKYLWIGGVVAALGGVAWYAMNQVKMIDKLCFNVTGYKIISIAAQGAKINLNLSVRNLGNLKIKVKKFKFNIFADEEFLATAYSDVALNINPKDIGSTTIQILLNPKMMLQNIGSVLQNSSATEGWKNIILSMDGGISLSKGGIPFYIPIKYGFKLSELTEGKDVESKC
jgi:hypothetical protein